MEITTIGLDLAKNFFKFTASTRPARSSSEKHCGAAKFCPSSRNLHLAWSEWRPAVRPITGRARLLISATRFA